VVDSGKGSAAVTLLAFRLLSNRFKQSGSGRAAIDCVSTIISISIESINTPFSHYHSIAEYEHGHFSKR